MEDLSDIKIDQVVIGSCTNGRISDLRIAAKILKNKKIDPSVRLIVIPATQGVYLEALKEGLIEIFINAECVVSTPTCGPCLGGHMGILAEGNVRCPLLIETLQVEWPSKIRNIPLQPCSSCGFCNYRENYSPGIY